VLLIAHECISTAVVEHDAAIQPSTHQEYSAQDTAGFNAVQLRRAVIQQF